MRACHYCQTTEKELRPYGPNGEIVCFQCGMSTPERRDAADRAIRAKLNACDGKEVHIGGPDGPQPGSPISKEMLVIRQDPA